MRSRFATVCTFAITALVITGSSSAALPFWWWTPTKASRVVVAKNPQLWQGRDPSNLQHTTIAKSACKGAGPLKRFAGVRYYRNFICKATWSFDTPSTQYPAGPHASFLICSTTKQRPLGVKCGISA